MSAAPETQSLLHTFTQNLTQFAQSVINQGNARAVQDLTQSVTQLAATTSTSIERTQEQLGAVQHPLNTPAPELQQLVQTLHHLPAALQQA